TPALVDRVVVEGRPRDERDVVDRLHLGQADLLPGAGGALTDADRWNCALHERPLATGLVSDGSETEVEPVVVVLQHGDQAIGPPGGPAWRLEIHPPDPIAEAIYDATHGRLARGHLTHRLQQPPLVRELTS